MTILDAINDPALFRPFLAGDRASLATWRPWLACLKVIYGLPLSPTDKETIQQCTGRDPEMLHGTAFSTVLLLTGRRSGKSRIAAIVAGYEAALAGHEKKLAKGETGAVVVVSPTKWQSRIVRNYIRAIFTTDLLAPMVVSETRDGFTLSNGIEIVILAGDWRTVRGPTLVSVVVDECAFLGLDEESKVRSDTELIRALLPGLGTTGGRLIAISSPYARKGWTWATFRKHHANNGTKTLVWNAPSRTMNPTLSREVVDQAMQEDRAAALSEYGGQFRDDISLFLPREVIEALVIPDRRELLPRTNIKYRAFADLSGGRADDAALAIAHRGDGGKVVIDLCRGWKPPFNPTNIIGEMAAILQRYKVGSVTGDNYSAEFTAFGFRDRRVHYTKCDKPKSALYLELLPRLCSGEIELLDDPVLVGQLAGLERRTRSGGKDVIDHCRRGHDDLANVIAGVAVEVSKATFVVGTWRHSINDNDSNPFDMALAERIDWCRGRYD